MCTAPTQSEIIHFHLLFDGGNADGPPKPANNAGDCGTWLELVVAGVRTREDGFGRFVGRARGVVEDRGPFSPVVSTEASARVDVTGSCGSQRCRGAESKGGSLQLNCHHKSQLRGGGNGRP